VARRKGIRWCITRDKVLDGYEEHLYIWCCSGGLPKRVNRRGSGNFVEWESDTAWAFELTASGGFEDVKAGIPLCLLPQPGGLLLLSVKLKVDGV